ncbi:MAG: hypothetical protein JWM31_102, partial [Solirubrobacterales bacterium]|nr:hypothetical protein [Solirubrobacterales bacterium]
MPRRPFATTLAAVLAVLCLSPAAARAADDGVPSPVPLTTNWERLADAANVGVGEGFWKPGAKGDWKPAVVPSVFSADPTAASFGGTTGWYRTTFIAPPADGAFTYDVHFEQVRRTAQVWLNGVKLGRHDDPYVPFDLPAGNALKPGQRNVLVVRADNRKDGAIREGWWNWGGITRPVTLVPRGALVLKDAGVMSDVDCPAGGATDGNPCSAKALFDGTLVNRSDSPVERPQVSVRLTDGRTSVVRADGARALAPGEQTRVQFAIPVPEAHLWSPADPHLYDVAVTTTAGDVTQQVDRWRTGLRQVAVRDGMLTLNGRTLSLRGASIQEDLPGRGPALREQDIATIVQELKDLHANVTRAHYLLNPRLLDALDAAGIMVWSQSPIYHRDLQLRTQAGRDAALSTVRNTILQARNHPSVIAHSVANELSPVPDTVLGTRRFLGAAHALARTLDPTVPAAVDLLSYPGYARQRAYAQYELLGINSYFGWYKGKAEHSVARLQDLGPFLDRMRKMYPSQALEVTEFGAESTFSGPATEKETYAFQTRYLRDVLKIIEERPFIGGAIYWTAREFAVKPNWVGGVERAVKRNSIHHKGLITYAGRKKPAWLVAARDFQDTSLYRSVSPAAAANVRGAGGAGGGSLLAIAIAAGVLGLLVVDGWALAGIWRRGPR